MINRSILIFLFLMSGACSILFDIDEQQMPCQIVNGRDPCPLDQGKVCWWDGLCKPVIECDQPMSNTDACPHNKQNKQMYCIAGICQPLVECKVNVGQPDPCPKYPTSLHCNMGECQQCIPTTEICNGIDDDCNGKVDELITCPPSPPTDQCDNDTCQPCIPSPEICNKKDDDCDGQTDEDIADLHEEICNGIDDDCDGKIDEDFDADGDGFMAIKCQPGIERIDCVDTNDKIHPPVSLDGLPAERNNEVCNGIDDDCDGIIDNNVPGCGREVCTETSCQGGWRCDPDTHLCLQPLDLGSTCQNNTWCKSDICVDPSVLSLQNLRGDNKFCSQACCSDMDCPEDYFCSMPNNGLRLCVPQTFLQTIPDQKKVCASNYDCPDEICVLDREVALSLYNTGNLTCGKSQAKALGWSLSCDKTCRSGICIDGTCGIPCGASDDCSSFAHDSIKCIYQDILLEESSSMRIPICTYANILVKPTGQSCTENWECKDASCVNGVCTNLCCNDDDCEEGTLCRPAQDQDEYWGMYCL